MADRYVARMVEEALADSESRLREEVRSYREALRQAIHLLHERHVTISRQLETIRMLREELRERMGVRMPGRAA